jgi:hypothetical protein
VEQRAVDADFGMPQIIMVVIAQTATISICRDTLTASCQELVHFPGGPLHNCLKIPI